MSRPGYSILVVDDDDSIRDTLFAILRSNGYWATGASSAAEALDKTRTQSFDLFLIDIKLPDMEGTQLLAQFQKTNPDAIKVIITGQPSFENVTRALNIGADSYFTKPFEPQLMLETIKAKLQERERKERITGKKLEEWVRLRISKTQSNEYNKFAEEAASTFVVFGLSKTQAKIYLGLNALGVASASEVAALSKVRREEVYRTLPELEKRGLITSKIGSPKRFVATEPKTALKILVKTKIEAMKKEVEVLRQKRNELVTKLESTSFGVDEENSIEAIFQQDNVQMRLEQILRKAKSQLKIASSVEETRITLLESIREILGKNPTPIDAQIIIDKGDPEDNQRADLYSNRSLEQFRLIFSEKNKLIDLRQVPKLPFNLILADESEAIWGDFQSDEPNRKVLWTNDPVQVDILKRAFEALWQEGRHI